MCTRRLGESTATTPSKLPRLPGRPAGRSTYEGPALATEDEPVTLIRFNVSKLSAVEVTVTRPDGKLVFDRLATFRRGDGSFTWTPARARACSPCASAAKELRTGLGQRRTAAAAEIEVESRLPALSDQVRRLMAPRTILYTGKGGVGKTSVAAATARRCAAAGLRTVVLSTDPAHSLSDSLEAELGAEPDARSARNLFGQEVQAQEEMERHWDGVQSWLGDLLARARRGPHLGRGADRAARAWTSCSRCCGSSATTRRASSTA